MCCCARRACALWRCMLHASGHVSIRLLNQLELLAYDARLRLTLPGGVDPRVIVAIDEASLLQEGQWPWPRQRLAQLTPCLRITRCDCWALTCCLPANPTLAAVDAMAQGPLRDNTGFLQQWAGLRPRLLADTQLAESFRSRPVVTGYYFSLDGQQGSDLRVGQLPAPVASRRVCSASPSTRLPAPPATTQICRCCSKVPATAGFSAAIWSTTTGFFAACPCCSVMVTSCMNISAWRSCAACWETRRSSW